MPGRGPPLLDPGLALIRLESDPPDRLAKATISRPWFVGLVVSVCLFWSVVLPLPLGV